VATADAHPSADEVVQRLFREEGASLVRLARLFTDDRSAAEDIVQEAFVRLHRSVSRIRDQERTIAYLRSIVLNLARDHNRRGLMSLRHHETLRHQETLAVETAGHSMEDAVVSGEDRSSVVSALGRLPGRQRDCLVLRFYLDLSEREIAATLGISPNSVKTHTRRGMAALRTRLARDADRQGGGDGIR
jgi:RNA polymerase sigma-70 factor (ECF subfamily)